MTVTIGIPTYNRKEIVGKLLLKLNTFCDFSQYKVLVIDDGSSDGTFEFLTGLNLNPEVFRIITRPNIGYAATFLELLEYSSTEWILVTSDDDDIDLNALNSLQKMFMLPDCSVVVTNWEYKDGTVARGGQSERLLLGTDLDQTMHAPGIAYRPSMLKDPMLKLNLFLGENSEAAFFYPQVIIAAYSIAARGAMFSPVTVVREIDEFPSGLISASGKNYWHPQSRINQYISFVDIYLDLKDSNFVDSKEIAKARLGINRQKYFDASEDLFAAEISRNEFRKQAILFYLRRYFSSLFKLYKLRKWLRIIDNMFSGCGKFLRNFS
jgi:glycosyltransferase involved in cell wall biosynthesis